MRRGTIATAALLITAGPAMASDLLNLTATERAAFHALIRDTLRANPEIVSRALEAPAFSAADLYADDISSDLARIRAEAATLFAPQDRPAAIALFVQPDCPDCTRARNELETLARKLDIRINIFDFSGKDAALAHRLGLDIAPSYVLRDRMIRGHMPAAVLLRYLERDNTPPRL